MSTRTKRQYKKNRFKFFLKVWRLRLFHGHVHYTPAIAQITEKSFQREIYRSWLKKYNTSQVRHCPSLSNFPIFQIHAFVSINQSINQSSKQATPIGGHKTSTSRVYIYSIYTPIYPYILDNERESLHTIGYFEIYKL